MTALRRICLVIILGGVLSPEDANALNRRITDCSNPNGSGLCWSQLDPSHPQYPQQYAPYVFGRREGEPPRGPNPVPGALFGSTDVDDVYDKIGLLNQYYLEKFGRNGPNGHGGTIFPGDPVNSPGEYRAFVNANGTNPGSCNPGNASAQFYPNATTGCSFCRGSASYDIIGHENSHLVSLFDFIEGKSVTAAQQAAVTFGSASGDNGAIEESLADFFGEGFERYATGSTDWFLSRTSNIDVTRSLADPLSSISDNLTPYPDRQLSPYVFTGNFDNGGIHINSTILSHGLYLATEGGSFNGFDIEGIGFDKMEQIVYRYQTNYLRSDGTVNGTFQNDAYPGIIQAASDLYSPEDVWEVTKALRAVELNMSRSFAGDFDGDGDKDGRDFLTWQRGLGTLYTQASLGRWQTYYGHGSLTASTAVPEPSAMLLISLGAIGLVTRRHFL